MFEVVFLEIYLWKMTEEGAFTTDGCDFLVDTSGHWHVLTCGWLAKIFD